MAKRLVRPFDDLMTHFNQVHGSQRESLNRYKRVIHDLEVVVDNESGRLKSRKIERMERMEQEAQDTTEQLRRLEQELVDKERLALKLEQKLTKEEERRDAAEAATDAALEQLNVIREIISADPELSALPQIEESFAFLNPSSLKRSDSFRSRGASFRSRSGSTRSNRSTFSMKSDTGSVATITEQQVLHPMADVRDQSSDFHCNASEHAARHEASSRASPAKEECAKHSWTGDHASEAQDEHEVQLNDETWLEYSREENSWSGPALSQHQSSHQSPAAAADHNPRQRSSTSSPVSPVPTSPRSTAKDDDGNILPPHSGRRRAFSPSRKSGDPRSRRHHFVKHRLGLRGATCDLCDGRIRKHTSCQKCDQCSKIYHDECMQKVAADCKPPVMGTPSAKHRQMPPHGSNLQTDIWQRSESGLVPAIIEEAIEALDARGPQSEGIYRLSGQQSKVRAIKEAFCDPDKKPPNLMTVGDVNEVAGALKLYLRELDEPLLTFDLYPQLIDAVRIFESRGHISRNLASLVKQLPAANFYTAYTLLRHLKRLSQHSEKTKMTSKKLALVFSPTILQSRSPPSELNLEVAGLESEVVYQLIELPEELWQDLAEHFQDQSQVVNDASPVLSKKKRRKSRGTTQ